MSHQDATTPVLRVTRRRIWLPCLVMLLLSAFPLMGQEEEEGGAAAPSEDEVNSYIAKLDSGYVEEAAQALPGLISRYQQNAGLLYLRGRLAENGIEAVKLYQTLVANFPASEWADDALYHVYQYYYAMGLYRTADAKLQQMKKDYPASPYIVQLGDTTKAKPGAGDPPPRSRSGELIVGESSATKLPPPLPGKPHVQETEKTPPRPSSGGRYTLQVGAFSTRANAEKQRQLFSQRGYTTEIVERPTGKKTLFVVYVGAYASADEARRAGAVIQNEQKISSMVVER